MYYCGKFSKCGLFRYGGKDGSQTVWSGPFSSDLRPTSHRTVDWCWWVTFWLSSIKIFYSPKKTKHVQVWQRTLLRVFLLSFFLDVAHTVPRRLKLRIRSRFLLIDQSTAPLFITPICRSTTRKSACGSICACMEMECRASERAPCSPLSVRSSTAYGSWSATCTNKIIKRSWPSFVHLHWSMIDLAHVGPR